MCNFLQGAMDLRHAYLIIVHHEFNVLRFLIDTIDDSRNDIFIHLDKKVKQLPELKTKHANLYFTKTRIDVRWGDVSQIEAEYVLFEEAFKNGSYEYYHLLSGVDLPLRSQDDIHAFFRKHRGKEFIGFSKGNLDAHIDRKINRYHLFSKHFKDSEGVRGIIRKSFRYLFLRLQYLAGVRRNSDVTYKKGTNWVSVTHSFIGYVLSQKHKVLKMYAYTFCGDEIFIQTICWNSHFRNQIFDLDNVVRGSQRIIGWKNNKLVEWEKKDFDMLIQSEVLFARKFSSKHIELVKRIVSHITNPEERRQGETF